ncbi:hypothetical protein ACS0TY_032590 [Phlomoides rotata]
MIWNSFSETGESVAIKKVMQDNRYKNHELQLMRLMDHSNVISLEHCFFSATTRDELFLNLVNDYVPETMYKVLKHYTNSNQRMPLIYVKLYTYQLFRGLAYMHSVAGVDPLTHQVKICDFGSAKILCTLKFSNTFSNSCLEVLDIYFAFESVSNDIDSVFFMSMLTLLTWCLKYYCFLET